MSLQTIVQTLGGDLFDGGCRASIPAPGHSVRDRSVSLLLDSGRVIVHTFGDSDWKAVLAHLRDHNLIDQDNAPTGRSAIIHRPLAVPARLERRKAAQRIWENGFALEGTASERHCRNRLIRRPLPGSSALRHHPGAPVFAYSSNGPKRQALLAQIRSAEGDLTAVEITYLSRQGHRAHDLRLSRKTVGQAPPGCAVRLDAPSSQMLVAEGVFSSLSASEMFDLPAWALLSVRNLAAWSPPEGVRRVIVSADRGKPGEAAAEALRGRLARAGLSARIELPPAPFGDWNDWAAAAADPAA